MKEADLLGAKNQFTRRRLLEGAGVVAAAAAAGSLMPPNVQRALAQGLQDADRSATSSTSCC